jgi:hypothetical protein
LSLGEAAGRADATEKDKADLKLIEQEYLAAQQKERRRSNTGDASRPRLDGKKALDKKLDKALEGAAPVKERDRSLPAVRVAEQQQPRRQRQPGNRSDACAKWKAHPARMTDGPGAQDRAG